jgi:hypothetical protein
MRAAPSLQPSLPKLQLRLPRSSRAYSGRQARAARERRSITDCSSQGAGKGEEAGGAALSAVSLKHGQSWTFPDTTSRLGQGGG